MMDEKQVNTLLQALVRQRNQALDAAAQLEAQVLLLQDKVAELTAQLAKEEPPP